MPNRNYKSQRGRFLAVLAAVCSLAIVPSIAVASHKAPADPPVPLPSGTNFEATAHNGVLIEWWYLNTHLTTKSGRHLAFVTSFFRFGTGVSPVDGVTKQNRSHILIYGITDLDKGLHQSYSYCDYNMMDLLRQLLPQILAENPKDKDALQMMMDLDSGRLPPPHQLLTGDAKETKSPFGLQYGNSDSLVQSANSDTDFLLSIGDVSNLHLSLNFHANSPIMAVGGNGQTGLVQPTDMYYYSLTNCAVTGSIDTGMGSDPIVKGDGWFDHQWGNTWGIDHDGWDWWGLKMDNGEQVLFYRQRDLTTGNVFSPSATFMDAQGNQTTTTNIVFTPDPAAVWTNTSSNIAYPLGWTVSFPDQKLSLHVQTSVQDQTIATMGEGGEIWEGDVDASGSQNGSPITAKGFMELVGYESQTTKTWVASLSK